ncbi:MAG: alternative oxidase [SAR86 cluster bacterium]|jgi:ubiquinol oxidase|nr:alternative oxidase [Gammaproteobacteria bacterium]MDA9834818.1 alternative oxidase [Gammaproteobacteria bacterium]MDC3372299.1 alternative oxidase [Gammaproteobacteria bacterium]MDO7562109.1 alternative oxidase [SAR86 cluster bacterium]MDO7701508.1 alternative oxidase [SAR86 cluster bacterium]
MQFITKKIKAIDISDSFAYSMTKFFRFIADTFFAKRYGHRAVVLETVAGVPGMVAGVWMHFKSLRAMKAGYGEQIREMLDEAENERMHLMFFIEIAKPNSIERFVVLSAQVIFGLFYLFMYVFFTKTAHRMIGYFEDEAVRSYTEYLEIVEAGKVENTPAPHIAINYYKLGSDAKLSDLIRRVRADEQHHSEKNHHYANSL